MRATVQGSTQVEFPGFPEAQVADLSRPTELPDPPDPRPYGQYDIDKLRTEMDANWRTLEVLIGLRDEAKYRHDKRHYQTGQPPDWTGSRVSELTEQIEVLKKLRPKPPTRRPWLIGGMVTLLGAVIYGFMHGIGEDIWRQLRTIFQ
ncbi:MAG: hypothetical protein CBC34_006795 [Hyphomicrobiaceae bacterium TMED74]|nr:hypothetical protein [Filomicrobium sp.]RPG43056.1 MAG: hypothetical protein CBC34_006795 [Hyphomicrobiaceae bacterium TMED74]